MNDNKITPSNKVILLFLEILFSNIFITGTLCLPLLLFDYLLGPFKEENMVKTVMFFSIAGYLNKDIVLGRSVIKRIWGYQVIDSETKAAPTITKSFIRNLTIFIYLLEYIYAFISPNKKIGDLFTNTEIIKAPIVPAKTILKDFGQLDYDNETRKLLGFNLVLAVIIILL